MTFQPASKYVDRTVDWLMHKKFRITQGDTKG